MHRLETERLILRPFSLDDAVELHRVIYSDIHVLRYYSGMGAMTLTETQQYLAEHLGAWREDDLGRLAAILKLTNQIIGQIHLDSYVNSFYRWKEEPNPLYNTVEVELAFAFGRQFWGKSYAYEACQAMVRYAFHDLKLRRLVGGAQPENIRSINLQRRLGYRIVESLNGPGYVTILDNYLIVQQ